MTTRRQVLAAALAAPAIILPVAVQASPALVCTTMTPSLQWQSAVDAMSVAQATFDAYYKATYEPAWNARKQQRHDEEWELQRQIDAIPHYTTELSYATADGGIAHMTSANGLHVRLAMSMAGEAGVDDYAQCRRELFKGIGKRIMQEHEIREGFTFSPSTEMPADMDAEYDRLDALNSAAWRNVVEFDAATPGDLIAKVAFLKAHQCDVDHDDLLADLHRIFGEPA